MTETIFTGIGVSEGIQIGKVYKFEHIQNDDAFCDLSQSDVENAVLRFKNAVTKASADVETLIAQSSLTLGKDKIGVLKGQKSILADPAYCPEIEKMIRKKLFSPEKAVKQVTEKFVQIFENMKNDYMKERAADVKDAGYRLLNILSGEGTHGISSISSPVILIAVDLMPSDTVQLNKELVLAFATQKGGKTSHTSIFAKSMGIPAVVGVAGIVDSVNDGDTVIVDGTQGLCIVAPTQETIKTYEQKMRDEFKEKQIFSQFANKNAATKDGSALTVAANIGSFLDVEYSLKQGAQAVGLMRTEQIYLSKDKLPDENEQFAEYKKIAEAYAGKDVIIRTLDIGGDKKLSYLKIPKEDNPFLGYRAIRLCLDQKEIFLTQLRAILRAGVFGNLKIMFPMISGYDELIAAKSILNEAKEQLKAQNISFNADIKTGIMIEIPSAALMADQLAKEVDFFSIGTNDLVQYTLAVDRGNEKVSYLYDYCNPAVIRLIKTVSDAAHKNSIPVGMCGGMAGDAIAIPLLVGLNLDEMSMSAGVIPKVKYVISRLKKADCIGFADKVSGCSSAKEIRALLKGFYMSYMD